MAKKSFTVINGPNLNLLGTREPDVYGSETLDDIKKQTTDRLKEFDVEIEWFQSNIEGEIVEKIQQISSSKIDALIINPAAYSHTSVAILDALKMLSIPVVEVHLSNTHHREEFRSTKLTAKASTIIMEGLGSNAYYMGIKSQLI
ncbi:MAG: 3-dehydroquinate dehydratase [Bacteriovoracaceae bacterium]|nr:3-dehydroquinate dehydratase [Bacteriovoracaceae bacterium]